MGMQPNNGLTVLVNGISEAPLRRCLAGKKGKEFLNLLSPDKIRKARTIYLLADTNATNTEILRDMKGHLKIYKGLIGLGCNNGGIRRSNQERYLRVYHLVEKEKGGGEISTAVWERLARRFYEDDYQREKHYAVRKVKRDYSRGKRVVDEK